jgi:DNA-binding NarL/FixJ family response regulator
VNVAYAHSSGRLERLVVKLRVLTVDDHQIFRKVLGFLLAKDPDIEIIAEAGDGAEALEKAFATHPDVVCMDVKMPRLNGIEATRRLVSAQPGVKVIGLSAYADKEYVLQMLNAGAVGYVTKSEAETDLIRAVHSVAEQHTYLCATAAAAVSETLPAPTTGAASSANQLDAREERILRLLGEGVADAGIAAQLYMDAATLGVHRRNIMRRLGLHSERELKDYAARYRKALN